mmetsp:Transcript_10608/g.23771  ORF Transcript_10608/g.23771 Transcript_10608/m.23771 type:complete len:615 (+) Transcript_10608:184-2028(+)
MSYTTPPWCQPPSSSTAWSIDEIKSGVLVSTHALTLPSTTFGRATDVVTIPTLHESCSRVHARIAFDSSGVAWLRDLGSGNGTTVNGKRMPPQSIGKEILPSDDAGGSASSRKEGARGVIVYPGDTIRLGASTRMYCLNGPQEFDRGAIRAKLEAAKIDALNQKQQLLQAQQLEEQQGNNNHNNAESGGISWGLDISDPTEEEDGVDASVQPTSNSKAGPILESDVPDRHRKLYEALRTKQYKLDNILEESRRIEAKGTHGDLTDGQRTRLEQNSSRAEELRAKIEEAEIELKEKIWGAGSAGTRKKKRSLEQSSRNAQEDDDVDNFFDKTAEKRRRAASDQEEGSGEAETEQSLTAKWKRLIADLNNTAAEVAGLKRRVDHTAARVAAADVAGDDDAFFMRNDLDLMQDNLRSVSEKEKAVGEELASTEKLLRIVNDKLVFDRSISFIGLETDRPRPKDAKSNAGSMMPPPPTTMGPPPPKPPLKRPSTETAIMPPGPRPPPLGADVMPPPPPIAAEKLAVAMAPPPPRRSKPVGPARGPAGGTLAAIRSAVSSPSANESKTKSSTANAPGAAPPPPGFSADDNDSKEDKWRAPEGQDGSGITKLNAKFAGRY